MNSAPKPILFALAVLTLLGCEGENRDSSLGPERTEEEIVADNVELVKEASAVFAAGNNGVYPTDVDVQTTVDGHTLLALLPGGQRLINPYTGEFSEPRNGLASESGQVGYERLERFGRQTNAIVINGFWANEEIARFENVVDLEAQTLATANAIVEAISQYAQANNQLYPVNVVAMIPYFPDARLFSNAITLNRLAPDDGLVSIPGSVGYAPIFELGYYVGCVVNAAGWGGAVDNLLYFDSTGDDSRIGNVLANCQVTRAAVERFATANMGVYPRNIGADVTTTTGETLLELISEELGLLSEALTNPFTGASEPNDMPASAPGQTGYTPVIEAGLVVGYVISGYGADDVIVELSSGG